MPFRKSKRVSEFDSIKTFISIISRQKQNARYRMVNLKEYVDFVERIPIIIYGK